MTNHYTGPSGLVAWATEAESKWSRNIYGIEGSLTGTETSIGEKTLLVHDLQGDIVGKASLSAEAKSLLSIYDSSEFGVPTKGAPPKYSWLGAGDVGTELPSGITNSNTTSYVPQLGRTLQTQTPVIPAQPEGNYSGTPYVTQLEPWVGQSDAARAAGGDEREAGRQAAAAQAAAEAAASAGTPAGDIASLIEESGSEAGKSTGWKWDKANPLRRLLFIAHSS